ncbi:MAG: hypothetical protein JWP27_2567, partial [Flaviaesturariibacter sp.]|nr:hypothetical protein [Flaviaesturariibacter sp.]
KTPVKGLVQDLVSGAHPYIPLIIPTLSDAARVIAPVPTIYFVPDDPAFGEYRSLFANTLCLLEEREPTPDKSDTKNTEKLLDRIFESQQVRVDQKALLRARILDMYIGDWDRHSDQWRWGIRDSNKLSVYYPIPRDRDQAFFYSEGLLVKFVQLMALRHLVSFDDDLAKVKSLNYKMWPFDMLLLNGLDRPQWKEILTELQAAFTDDVIHEAMAHLPPEIYALRGARLEKKLRERREDLVRQGLHYYRFISARVDVYGTNAAETFEVSGMGSDVVVKVYAMKGDGRGGLLYERRFVKDDTEVVRLFGLRGNDRFVVADGVKSRIRIELHGEDGDDRYEVGSGRVKVVE